MSLVFESERLVFRPLVDGDLDLLIEQWTDPDVARFVGGRIYTEQELARDMPKVTRRCAGGCIGNWCLVEKSTGGKIGTINLLPMPVDLADTDWELVDGDALPEGDIELGYILKKSAWGEAMPVRLVTGCWRLRSKPRRSRRLLPPRTSGILLLNAFWRSAGLAGLASSGITGSGHQAFG